MLRCTQVNPSKSLETTRAAAAIYLLALSLGADAPPLARSEPVLSRVFPPAASVGNTVTWTIEGRNLAQVESLLIGRGGATGRILERSDELLRAEVTTEAGSRQGFRLVQLQGPTGVSNPRLVRIDQVRQVIEVEPNDSPEEATALATESVCAGVLDTRDLDFFRFTAKAGQVLTIEVEARRLGSPVEPVLSLSTAEGRALAQAVSSREIDGDCRLVFAVPRAGDYLVKLHDRLYQGSKRSTYRLRITEQPFATGLFPLGGSSGASVRVSASGGSLRAPLEQTMLLREDQGSLVEIPPFDGGVLAPGHLFVSGPGTRERSALKPATGPGLDLALGDVINGRIERPGEVEHFRLPVKAGTPVRIRVEAALMGSALDGVLTVRDEAGAVIAESDDRPSPFASRRVALGLPAHDSDPALTLTPERDGVWSIALTDRFDGGGPGFAYRLYAERPLPRVALAVFAFAGEPSDDDPRFRRLARSAFNLAPGAQASLPFSVAVDGRAGPITVRAEGLPEGVRAEPVVVRASRPLGTGTREQAVEGAIILRADASAPRGLGTPRLVASASPSEGPELRQVADVWLVFEAVPGEPASRPVVRRGAGIPVSVVAEERKTGR